MKAVSVILIISYLVFSVFELITVFSGGTLSDILVGEALCFGALFILFGFTLFRAEQHFGRKGVLAGLLEVLAGLTFLTVILGFIGLFVQIPAEILEIVILYLAATQTNYEASEVFHSKLGN